MGNPYYYLARLYKTHSRKRWFIIPFSITLGCLFIILGVVLEGEDKLENGQSIFGFLGCIALIPTMLIYLLQPISTTFTRLEEEKGVYKNHKLQEWVYTIVYTGMVIGFVTVLIAGIVFSITGLNTLYK